MRLILSCLHSDSRKSVSDARLNEASDAALSRRAVSHRLDGVHGKVDALLTTEQIQQHEHALMGARGAKQANLLAQRATKILPPHTGLSRDFGSSILRSDTPMVCGPEFARLKQVDPPVTLETSARNLRDRRR